MIKEYEYKGHMIRVFDYDGDVESPRDYENLGTIITFHRSHNFTDTDAPKLKSNVFDSWDGLKDYLVRSEEAVVILPIYALIHGGISISTKPFNDPFDSGQIGFIYTTRKKMSDHRTFKRLTKNLLEWAENDLVGEIQTFDQWLRGEFYGFVIDPQHENDTEGLHDEYSGGFYDMEHLDIVAQDTVDGLAAFDEEQAFIKNLAPEDLPKYINHEWKYPYASDDAFKNRLKEVSNGQEMVQ